MFDWLLFGFGQRDRVADVEDELDLKVPVVFCRLAWFQKLETIE